MIILRNKVAKGFFLFLRENSINGTVHPITLTKCCGYWKDGDLFFVFDNHFKGEPLLESFNTLEEALEYIKAPKSRVRLVLRDFGLKMLKSSLILNEVKPTKKGDVFLWKAGNRDEVEIHTFHSDVGYGIKTFTNYDEEDGSSLLVNHSGVCGTITNSYNE